MTSIFNTDILLGIQHISDVEGFDHIAFLVTLLAAYTINEWKKILLLVTAFTIGHSITLALAALDIIPVNASLIEFLIPVTICCTALYHLFAKETKTYTSNWGLYVLTIGFGLIHGAGFSNFLKAMLGNSSSVVQKLLAFNIGVEIGQLIIVSVLLGLSSVFLALGQSKTTWKHLCIGYGLFTSIILMIATWPF